MPARWSFWQDVPYFGGRRHHHWMRASAGVAVPCALRLVNVRALASGYDGCANSPRDHGRARQRLADPSWSAGARGAQSLKLLEEERWQRMHNGVLFCSVPWRHKNLSSVSKKRVQHSKCNACTLTGGTLGRSSVACAKCAGKGSILQGGCGCEIGGTTCSATFITLTTLYSVPHAYSATSTLQCSSVFSVFNVL